MREREGGRESDKDNWNGERSVGKEKLRCCHHDSLIIIRATVPKQLKESKSKLGVMQNPREQNASQQGALRWEKEEGKKLDEEEEEEGESQSQTYRRNYRNNPSKWTDTLIFNPWWENVALIFCQDWSAFFIHTAHNVISLSTLKITIGWNKERAKLSTAMTGAGAKSLSLWYHMRDCGWNFCTFFPRLLLFWTEMV